MLLKIILFFHLLFWTLGVVFSLPTLICVFSSHSFAEVSQVANRHKCLGEIQSLLAYDFMRFLVAEV